MNQLSLFDAAEAARRRDAGIEQASSRFAWWLRAARSAAVVVAFRDGFVNADRLRAEGIEPPEGASPNIYGAVFKDSRFEFAGFAYSARPERHRNLIRNWRLKL